MEFLVYKVKSSIYSWLQIKVPVKTVLIYKILITISIVCRIFEEWGVVNNVFGLFILTNFKVIFFFAI